MREVEPVSEITDEKKRKQSEISKKTFLNLPLKKRLFILKIIELKTKGLYYETPRRFQNSEEARIFRQGC
jgi:hypothetical protein